METTPAAAAIRLYGRVILEGKIEALTGLHIGGSPGALAIGGVDLPVIRNPVDQRPYIPGSSLKGKMRSLWEKATGARQNRGIGKGVSIHACETKDEYSRCPVCQIFGTLGQNEAAFPTRIVVRDVPLAEDSLKDIRTDMPFTEVKWEAAIDRVTSAATPRQIERVPAGAVFGPMQIVFNIYDAGDFGRFLDVLTALQLVEDDYLGGQGSRGSGRVAFQGLTLTCKSTANYQAGATQTLASLQKGSTYLEWMRSQIPLAANGGE
jgi:CRISPR-associated protein Csm3